MKTAVILPCYNEAAAIGQLIDGIRSVLPDSDIYVFDNNSIDNSIDIAKSNGAKVYSVSQQGKGNVVKAMFRDVSSDYYIMMDADGTYPYKYLTKHLQKCRDEKIDMLIGSRISNYSESGSRKGHYIGNRLLTNSLNFLFSSDFKDILSGYRIMSNRFVKSVPLFTGGFEVETVLSIHAVEVDAKIAEEDIEYLQRKEGSSSKLNTYRDGLKILFTIIKLFSDHKPILFYGIISIILLLSGLLLGIPVVFEFFETGLVPRFPTAILSSALVTISFIISVTGLILSSISRNRKIIKKLAFLSIK